MIIVEFIAKHFVILGNHVVRSALWLTMFSIYLPLTSNPFRGRRRFARRDQKEKDSIVKIKRI